MPKLHFQIYELLLDRMTFLNCYSFLTRMCISSSLDHVGKLKCNRSLGETRLIEVFRPPYSAASNKKLLIILKIVHSFPYYIKISDWLGIYSIGLFGKTIYRSKHTHKIAIMEFLVNNLSTNPRMPKSINLFIKFKKLNSLYGSPPDTFSIDRSIKSRAHSRFQFQTQN